MIRAIVADRLQKTPDDEIERPRQEASEDDENEADESCSDEESRIL